MRGGVVGAVRIDFVDFAVVVIVNGHRRGDVLGVIDGEATEQVVEGFGAVSRGAAVAVVGDGRSCWRRSCCRWSASRTD